MKKKPVSFLRNWTVHNLVGHPASEVLNLSATLCQKLTMKMLSLSAAFRQTAQDIHEATVPQDDEEKDAPLRIAFVFAKDPKVGGGGKGGGGGTGGGGLRAGGGWGLPTAPAPESGPPPKPTERPN